MQIYKILNLDFFFSNTNDKLSTDHILYTVLNELYRLLQIQELCKIGSVILTVGLKNTMFRDVK